MKITSLNHKLESSYSWAVIPDNLPKENLFFVTAKTASPAIHPEDKEDTIRQFSLPELHEAGRSLGRRSINMNHNQRINIEYAFTVDAQYNPTTEAVEALIYVPNYVRDMINRGEIKKPSVEYVWRDIVKTEVGGSEFVGIIFDKIALLEESWLQSHGYTAGDALGEIRKAEASGISEIRGYLDGKMEAVVEAPPEQAMKQDMITESLIHPEQGFYNAEKCKECKKLSECSANFYKECTQKSEGTNVMPIAPDGPVLNQTPVSNKEPNTNVASAGMVTDATGAAYFGKVEGDNPHKNLDMPKAPSNVMPANNLAKEGSALSDSTPIATSNEINVIGMDESKQKVESAVAEPKKEEKKPEPVKAVEPIKAAAPIAEPVKEPIKSPEPPIAPVAPVAPVEDYKSKFEAVSQDLVKVKAHEAFLEESCKKLSDNSKASDKLVADAKREGIKQGKQKVIGKIEEVIPKDSQFGYNIQNSTRSLIYNVKKKLYEMTEE